MIGDDDDGYDDIDEADVNGILIFIKTQCHCSQYLSRFVTRYQHFHQSLRRVHLNIKQMTHCIQMKMIIVTHKCDFIQVINITNSLTHKIILLIELEIANTLLQQLRNN